MLHIHRTHMQRLESEAFSDALNVFCVCGCILLTHYTRPWQIQTKTKSNVNPGDSVVWVKWMRTSCRKHHNNQDVHYRHSLICLSLFFINFVVIPFLQKSQSVFPSCRGYRGFESAFVILVLTHFSSVSAFQSFSFYVQHNSNICEWTFLVNHCVTWKATFHSCKILFPRIINICASHLYLKQQANTNPACLNSGFNEDLLLVQTLVRLNSSRVEISSVG